MNRTPISRKTKKPVTAGDLLDQRARAHMGRHKGINYGDALRAVLRRDKKLLRAYNRPPAQKDVLADLRLLADFLNEGAGAERNELVSILRPLIGYDDAAPETVKNAAWRLAGKLNNLQTTWIPLEAPRPSFGIMFPGGWYGTIAHAIQYGHLFKLKVCAWESCNRFFVTEDHRVTFCNERCYRQSESWRVKQWRIRTEN